MTTKRFLPGVLLMVATAGPAAAQYGGDPNAAPNAYPGLIPSVAPLGMGDPAMPPGRPTAAANTTPLDRVYAPIRQVGAETSAPYSTLTGQPPPQTQSPGGLPPGSYPGLYSTDALGCCGPVGRCGGIGEELYLDTGPTWAYGGGDFTHRLNMGWMVGGGGRSLFFNQANNAAWVVDLGLSYQYNRGNQNDPINLNVRQPNTSAGAVQPDILTNVIIRDIDRTNFNFGIGHDWWLMGSGATGGEDGWNVRVGALVGGRWGSAHVDLVPVVGFDQYARRQDVTHGVFLQVHANVEIPLGSVILFTGLQVQWGYDWTNLVPPIAGDIQNINLLMHAGIRF